MSNTSRTSMFLLGATLALGFAWSAHQIAGALGRIRQANTIRVKGTAERAVTSNRAAWTGELILRGEAVDIASRSLEAARAKLLAFLRDAGVPADALSVGPVSVQAENTRDANGNPTRRIEFYVLRQKVTFTVNDVTLADAVARKISSLLSEGMEIVAEPPRFLFTQLDDLKMDLLREASKNARDRAVAIVAASGKPVGSVVSAAQGVFQITPLDSTEVSGEGENDTTAIHKVVRAVVTLEFSTEH